MVDLKTITKVLCGIAGEYPADLVKVQMRDIPRMAFNISLALSGSGKKPSELSIADLGGGIGLFSPGCAALGFKRVLLIDDFMDSVNRKFGDSILSIHKKYGVEVISRNIVNNGLGEHVHALDVVTTFDSIEHWHHSPKKLFGEVIAALNSGGLFVMSAPNCVNLRKRITVVLGKNKWSSIQEWYEAERFRGHVREPDVSDFLYIARDMALTNITILGRNWLGYYASQAIVRRATMLFDRLLRCVPALCSDIYLIGQKP